MKINTDCIYIPAQKPPKVCQDYAICSNTYPSTNENPFLIICDGCGSSNNTDIGARLLAHSFRRVFEERGYNFKNLAEKLEIYAISLADIALKTLKINNDALDATLIFSMVDGGFIKTRFFGDGYLLSLTKDKEIIGSHKISYSKNAPHYLSYRINKIRQDLYFDMQSDDLCPIKIKNLISSDQTSLTIDCDFVHYSIVENLEFYFIMSDGVESFMEISTGKKIPPLEIMKMIGDIKSKPGEFIKRRVRAVIKELAEKGIYNYDDLSVAAFSITE